MADHMGLWTSPRFTINSKSIIELHFRPYPFWIEISMNPSTFVIGSDGKVKFSKVSTGHGGRTNPDEILAKL